MTVIIVRPCFVYILNKTWPNFSHLVLSPNLAYPLENRKWDNHSLSYYFINQNASYFTTSPSNFVIFKGKYVFSLPVPL